MSSYMLGLSQPLMGRGAVWFSRLLNLPFARGGGPAGPVGSRGSRDRHCRSTGIGIRPGFDPSVSFADSSPYEGEHKVIDLHRRSRWRSITLCSFLLLDGFHDALGKAGEALDLGGDDDLGGLAVGGGGEGLQGADLNNGVGGVGVV